MRYVCRYARLPKTLHCSTPSVAHTVSCVIFSFIFHRAKVIAHRRTTAALPDSFLPASFYLSLWAPRCLRQSSAEVASFMLSLPPWLQNSVGSSHSALSSRGNSDCRFCSEAGKTPSSHRFTFENDCPFLSQPISCEASCGLRDHRRCKGGMTPSRGSHFEYHSGFSVLLTVFPFHAPKTAWSRHFFLCWHSTDAKQEERCSVRVDWRWRSCSQSQATLTDVMSLLSVSNFPEGLSYPSHRLFFLSILEAFQSHPKMGSVPFKWKCNSKLSPADFKVIINKWSQSLCTCGATERTSRQCLSTAVAQVN